MNSEKIIIEDLTSPEVVFNPDITGNSFDGDYLVVWEQNMAGGGFNIYGQRVGPGEYEYVYLPLVVR